MGWIIDDVADAKDQGITIRHESFGADEFIKVHSIVTDDKVRAANQAAAKGKDEDGTEYRVHLIHSMIIEAHVLNARTKKPLTWTETGIRKLSTQQKIWLVSQINTECTGMRAVDVTVELGGQKDVDFREST